MHKVHYLGVPEAKWNHLRNNREKVKPGYRGALSGSGSFLSMKRRWKYSMGLKICRFDRASLTMPTIGSL